jgi:hypothetical protein
MIVEVSVPGGAAKENKNNIRKSGKRYPSASTNAHADISLILLTETEVMSTAARNGMVGGGSAAKLKFLLVRRDCGQSRLSRTKGLQQDRA